MKLRYELIDTVHPTWRGMRFEALASAERELARSIPAGRFVIKDRLTHTLLPTETSAK